MRRYVPLLVVLALLVATVAAFGRTQLLKLEPSPITGPSVQKQFSPVCECTRTVAPISFRLRQADRVTVSIVDADGETVSTLVRGKRYPAGRVLVAWSGRNEGGTVVTEGVYRPKVELGRHGRTITLPNEINVDLTAPELTLVSAQPSVISPDGDGIRDGIRVRYRLDEEANALLFVDGRREVRTLRRPLDGTIGWFGLREGKPLRADRYSLTLAARDAAGNVSTAVGPISVRIRYVELLRTRIRVAPGRSFGVRFRTDAKTVSWRLGRRSGISGDGRIEIRAPLQPGTYTLVVTARGHASRAAVYVRRLAGPRSANTSRAARISPVSGQSR